MVLIGSNGIGGSSGNSLIITIMIAMEFQW